MTTKEGVIWHFVVHDKTALINMVCQYWWPIQAVSECTCSKTKFQITNQKTYFQWQSWVVAWIGTLSGGKCILVNNSCSHYTLDLSADWGFEEEGTLILWDCKRECDWGCWFSQPLHACSGGVFHGGQLLYNCPAGFPQVGTTIWLHSHPAGLKFFPNFAECQEYCSLELGGLWPLKF